MKLRSLGLRRRRKIRVNSSQRRVLARNGKTDAAHKTGLCLAAQRWFNARMPDMRQSLELLGGHR
jgi:hypothetical protein